MPTQKITDAIVAKALLPEGKREAVIWDSELTGFGLRLRGGAKTYIVYYRPVGAGRSSAAKRVRVGTPSTIKTATEARALARVLLGQVATGIDPAAERAARRKKAETSIGDLLDAYDRDLERRKYVNRRVTIAGLRSRLADLLDRDITTVTGAEYAKIIDHLENAGKRGAAEDFRSRCRAFLTFSMARARILTSNPLAGYRKERATRADRIAKIEHGRALTDIELVKVWNAADPASSFGRLIRFLILTGCRRGEGVGLTWAMIDRRAGLIKLPAAFVKQGRGHDAPISTLLASVLNETPLMAGVELVFPSPRSGGQFSGWTQMTAKLHTAAGVAFKIHDLRRTFRTGLARLGVEDSVAELAIGHARKDLEARYNRDQAAQAVRAAFDNWDAHVGALIDERRSEATE